ncbi:MAG: hypothetical protein GY953_03510 [bacterium]|nr:hypothetical protein [bacterium]
MSPSPPGEAEGLAASESRYIQAGGMYCVLGFAVMAITVLTPGLASPERRTDLIHLLIGLPFFVLFAALIAFGDRLVAAPLKWMGSADGKAAAIGTWVREKLTMLLTFSALGRTFIFAANGVGWKPSLDWRSLTLSFEAVAPMPRMLVNAALMVVIMAFFVRAAWIPFILRPRGGNSTGSQLEQSP